MNEMAGDRTKSLFGVLSYRDHGAVKSSLIVAGMSPLGMS